MKLTNNASDFFSEKEYKQLKHKYLTRKAYRKFIEEIHEATITEHIIDDKNGFRLPENLGYIKILKFYNPNSDLLHFKEFRKYSTETLGWCFRFKWLISPKMKVYNGLFNVKKTEIKTRTFTDSIYRFRKHREARKVLSEVTRNYQRDFHT